MRQQASPVQFRRAVRKVVSRLGPAERRLELRACWPAVRLQRPERAMELRGMKAGQTVE